jgi:hypothetical protein
MSSQPSNFVTEDRIGIVMVAWHNVRNNPELIQRVLSYGIVIGVENSILGIDNIKYLIASPLFDIVYPGQTIPKYDVIITQSDRNYQISFQKQIDVVNELIFKEDSIHVWPIQKEE